MNKKNKERKRCCFTESIAQKKLYATKTTSRMDIFMSSSINENEK